MVEGNERLFGRMVELNNKTYVINLFKNHNYSMVEREREREREASKRKLDVTVKLKYTRIHFYLCVCLLAPKRFRWQRNGVICLAIRFATDNDTLFLYKIATQLSS